MNEAIVFVVTMLAATVPLVIAGLGLLINEKVGVLNLGAEGLMLVGAVAGFAGAFYTGSSWFGLISGALCSMGLTFIFGLLVIYLMTNQYATGLALTLFGTGFSAFVGTGLVQQKLDVPSVMTLPWLANTPYLGRLFQLHPLVYLVFIFAFAVGWFFNRTRYGLVLRAIGEAPQPAHALGYPVRRIRLLVVMMSGALCGLAGAYLSVIYLGKWSENMVAGLGWIALALTSFATWRPARVLLGAYLFGGLTALDLFLQARDIHLIDNNLMKMLPYLATIVVLVLISRKPQWIRLNMPASLGKPFYPAS